MSLVDYWIENRAEPNAMNKCVFHGTQIIGNGKLLEMVD